MGHSSFGKDVSSVSRPATVPSPMTVILRGLREIESMDILTRTLPLVFYRGGRCFGTPRGKHGVRGSFRS